MKYFASQSVKCRLATLWSKNAEAFFFIDCRVRIWGVCDNGIADFCRGLLVFEAMRLSQSSLVFCRERACSFRMNQTQGYCFCTVEMRQTVIENTYYPRFAIIRGYGTSKPVPYDIPWRECQSQVSHSQESLIFPSFPISKRKPQFTHSPKSSSFRNLSSNEVRYKFREREKFGYSPNKA